MSFRDLRRKWGLLLLDLFFLEKGLFLLSSLSLPQMLSSELSNKREVCTRSTIGTTLTIRAPEYWIGDCINILSRYLRGF